ncbi:11557_t:CDS:2 [Ambispora leptoticha]|uniref:11557_t:CDS:1 n=1 Tax=Ambispora leptoticha TaxID=144679 RepID=A0A9N9AC68_9GLOM|nr:11557_t:CDS:2 [Ambispora leptoticha]
MRWIDFKTRLPNSGEQKEGQTSSAEQNKKTKPTKRPRVQNNNHTNSEGLLFTNLTPNDYRKSNINNVNVIKRRTKSKAVAPQVVAAISNISQSSQQKIAPKPRNPITLKIVSRSSATDNPPPPITNTEPKAPALAHRVKIITTQTQQNNDTFSQNLPVISVQEDQPTRETNSQENGLQPSQSYSNPMALVLSTNKPTQDTFDSQENQNNIPKSYNKTLEPAIFTESPSINDFSSRQTFAGRKLQISDIIDLPETFSNTLNVNDPNTKSDVHGIDLEPKSTGSPRVVIEASTSENNLESIDNNRIINNDNDKECHSSNITHDMAPTIIVDDGNNIETLLPTVMIDNKKKVNILNADNDANSQTGNLTSNQNDTLLIKSGTDRLNFFPITTTSVSDNYLNNASSSVNQFSTTSNSSTTNISTITNNTPLRISTSENDMNLPTLMQAVNNNHQGHLHRSPRDSIFGDSSSELSTVQTFSDSSQNNSPINQNFRSPFSQIHDDSSLSLNLDDVSSLSPTFDDGSSSSSPHFYEDAFVSSPFPDTFVNELNNNPSVLSMEDNDVTSSAKSTETYENKLKSPQPLQGDALSQPENELTSTFAASLTLSLPNSPKDNLSASPSHNENCTCEKCTTESDDLENMDYLNSELEKPIPQCLMDDAELEQVREPRVDLPPNANELSDVEAMPYIIALCKRYWLYRTLAMLIRLGHVKLNDEELSRLREVKADLEGSQISESLQEVFRKEIHERMVVERARLERAKLWTEEDTLELDGPDDNDEFEEGSGSDSEMDDEYEDAVSSTYFEGQETMLSRQGMILKENGMSPTNDNKLSNSF